MDFLGKCVVWIIGALLSGAIYAGGHYLLHLWFM